MEQRVVEHVEKKQRVEKGQDVREWMESIGLGQYADALIEKGYDDLDDLQAGVDLKTLKRICGKAPIQMATGHLDKFMRKLYDCRVPVEKAGGFIETMPSFSQPIASAVPAVVPAFSTPVASVASPSPSVTTTTSTVSALTATGIASSAPGSGSDSVYPISPSAAQALTTTSGRPLDYREPSPNYSEVPIDMFDDLVSSYPLLKTYPDKDTKQPVSPYTFQKQLTVGALHEDIYAPDCQIINIASVCPGVGKSKWMDALKDSLGGYELTLDPKVDFKAIREMRKSTNLTQDKWRERPLLIYDSTREASKLLNTNMSEYFEDLSEGSKAGGKWPAESRPLIIFIGNQSFSTTTIGNFSGHRIDFYGIRGIGDADTNERYRDYGLVVDVDRMKMMREIEKTQSRTGNFGKEASDRGVSKAIYIFRTHFQLFEYTQPQPSAKRLLLKDVASKLSVLCPTTFGHFLSKSGDSVKEQELTKWFFENKGSFGPIEPFTWVRGKTMLNVAVKNPPSFS